jgi:TRAP-type uncharacterized transport system substrate-binding protein
MTMGSTLWQAYNGIDAFKDDGKLDVLTLMHMYAAPQHVVTSKMADQVAYDCVKIFIEKRDEIQKTTPHASEFTPEKAGVGIIPFHPGAAKYFEENGVKVDTK